MKCGRHLPPVLEIKNTPCPVDFLTLETPGTLEENPPEAGKYRNVLLVYQDSNARVMFDSVGIPSILVGDGGASGDFEELANRPSYDGAVMTGDTNIPRVPEVLTNTEYNSLWS